MTGLKVVQREVLVTVAIPSPEQVAQDVMALHKILEMLIAEHYTPKGLEGQRGDIASGVVPVLRHVSEQARRAAINIDHLARGC